jgi:hypothetical protein
MARPHCDKHKRYVPYCDACKALVQKAEEKEAAERQEASEALEADVGFSAETPETTEADKRIAELEAQTQESVEVEEEERALVGLTGAPAANVPPDDLPTGDIDETEAAMAKDGEFDEGEVAPAPLMFPEESDDTNPPPGQVSDAEAVGFPDSPKPAVEIDGDGNVVTEAEDDPIPTAEECYNKGASAGRKEVIAAVREYFSDGIDTVAFKLLEWLAEKYK